MIGKMKSRRVVGHALERGDSAAVACVGPRGFQRNGAGGDDGERPEGGPLSNWRSQFDLWRPACPPWRRPLRSKFRVGFDPGDGKVMVAADCMEKAPDPLIERLFAARFGGVIPEESYEILPVGDEVDAPPDHWRVARRCLKPTEEHGKMR